jgi:hypothetical protein
MGGSSYAYGRPSLRDALRGGALRGALRGQLIRIRKALMRGGEGIADMAIAGRPITERVRLGPPVLLALHYEA